MFEGKEDILPVVKRLMSQVDYSSKPIRLIGLAVSNPPEDIRCGEWVEGELEFKD